MNQLPVVLRPPTPDDLHFIANSWLKSNRNSDLTTFIDNKIYFQSHAALIQRILVNSLVTIISNPEDSNHVYGYVVYQMNGDNLLIHYIYIKYTYRNMGLAKHALTSIYPQFGSIPVEMTHIDKTLTRIVDNTIKHTSCFIKKRDKYKLIYNPYKIV